MLTRAFLFVIIAERDKNAGVAQLVEQLICNQQVGGSSPSTSSIVFSSQTSSYGRVPEWPKGADCKSVVSDFDGSNPSSPTKQSKSKDLLFCLVGKKKMDSKARSHRVAATKTGYVLFFRAYCWMLKKPYKYSLLGIFIPLANFEILTN